ncbi:hypothetical protein [Corynebacterium tapiri]|uniref:Uncharacterized protein n=1 Tax=Corynebacterium tapiri TaxID=1448266 RepID=A0A5C4U6D8_9CORY|nr:hypothetical protein [Corynebacterium tapiri]TNL99344.1 hypothetical protein FHE74_03020 [Corynebacterium tapiri]
MPTIRFDVLAPDDAAAEIRAAFENAGRILCEHKRLHSYDLSYEDAPQVSEQLTQQLWEVYEREHAEVDQNARVRSLSIEATGESLSYNELAMSLARILTPRADLPNDPVALENELAFEIPAAYPWSVEILR